MAALIEIASIAAFQGWAAAAQVHLPPSRGSCLINEAKLERKSILGMILFVLVCVLCVLVLTSAQIMLGHGRFRTIGPPIWRWSEWRAHWRPTKDPLSEPLYQALPANEWLTCDEIFNRVPRTVIGDPAEVKVRMDSLVEGRLAERRIPARRKFLFISYVLSAEICYRKIEFLTATSPQARSA